MATRFFPLLALFSLLVTPVTADAAKIRIEVQTAGGIQQRVYLTRPVHLPPDRPIVFVMHGPGRNAEEHRDQWHELALENDFLLVAPEFSERQFAGADAYELGHVFDAAGRVRPATEWSFSAIEPIFDEVRRRFGMTSSGYAIYGHAAGAEFVHRFLLHVPGARVTHAVVANAGWYTMPVYNVAFPYGLRNSLVTPADLAAVLSEPVTILLGEQDINPLDPSLNRQPDAMLQGSHRFARGQAFFDAAAHASARLGVPFGWQLVTVPGANHDKRRMAPAAIPWLLEETGAERPASGERGQPQEPERLPEVLPATGP